MSVFVRLAYKLAFPALLLLSCTVSPLFAQGSGAKGKAPAKGKLPGIRIDSVWYLTCEYERSTSVYLSKEPIRSGSSHMMLAFHFFYGEGQCTTGCDAPQSRNTFLAADVSGLHLHGRIHFCTTDKALAVAKNLNSVFDCAFEGDFDPATDTITGNATSEYWSSPDGNPANYARDPAGDRKILVTLKLKGGKGDHPQAPPDKNPTPVPDPRDGINKPLIDGLNGFFDGERAKNPHTHPPQRSGSEPLDANPTPTPDTNPLLGINDTLNNVLNDLNWLINRDPKNPSTPPPQRR